jgi:hypothetical protein
MKKAILILLLAAGFTAGAQNFIKEYPFWNTVYGNQFVYTYPDGYATVGIKKVGYYFSIAVIRTDLNGDTLFTRTLVDTLSNYLLERSVADADGFHYLSFAKNSSACVARFTPDWELQWLHKYELARSFESIAINRDNDLLAVGVGVNDGDQLHLFCLASSGNLIWEKSIISNNSERPITIIELENGDISIPVKMWNGVEMVYYGLNIYNFTASGDSLSYISTTLNGQWPLVRQIINNNDTLAIIYINRHLTESAYYFMLIKTDGTFIFEKELSLFETGYDIFNAILTPGNEVLITGNKDGSGPDSYSTFIYAMSFSGDSLWSVDYGNNFDVFTSDIQLCVDGGYIVSGNQGNMGNRTVYLLKTDSVGYINILGTNEYSTINRVCVYPNPATEFVTFEMNVQSAVGSGGSGIQPSGQISSTAITVMDITGRLVALVPVTGVKTVWDSKGVSPGVYLYQINNGSFPATGKFMISH